MKLRLTDRALRDLARIHDYILPESQEAANRTVDRLLKAAALLEEHPRLGRQSQLRRRRELIIDDHLLIYSVHRDEVVVGAIVRGGRVRKEIV